MMFPKSGNVRLEGKAKIELYRAVYDRDNGECVCCGAHVDFGTIPHHEPLRGKGGQDKIEDVFTLCMICHDIRHFRAGALEVKRKVLEVKASYGYGAKTADGALPVAGGNELADDQVTTVSLAQLNGLLDGTIEGDGRRVDACACSSGTDEGQRDCRADGTIVAKVEARPRSEKPSEQSGGRSALGKNKAKAKAPSTRYGRGEGEARCGKESGESGSKRRVRAAKKRGRKPGKFKASLAEIRARVGGQTND